MSYDFSSSTGRSGPSAPVPWIARSALHLIEEEQYNDEKVMSKIMLGLNFYGNDFGKQMTPEAIVAHQYVSLLKKYKPRMLWDESSQEHYFFYTDRGVDHVVYFPTPAVCFLSDPFALTLTCVSQYILARLKAIRDLHTQVAIWELGQVRFLFFFSLTNQITNQ